MKETAMSKPGQSNITRREFNLGCLKTVLVSSLVSSRHALALHHGAAWRAVNIMNFIRAEEPREPMDLVEPVREQMALIKKYKLPATWLLQYDAMVEGPFVELLKKEMPADHETGIWFEMNRKICDDAGIAWRGNPKWEWDYHVPVAYAIGYKPDERRKLADTAMATHKRIFGQDAKSVASWNLDAVTIAHLADTYGIDALGNCRDQLATDGFTIWGAPIAAYYPCRKNAWSPALALQNQIGTPMFRLLGQDPVYYYDKVFSYPDTMEPVWASGRSETFVDRFLEMIASEPTQALAYAQLGQENSFGWPEMREAYPMQMEKLAEARTHGLIVETMGATGRRFKQSFKTTPTQAQVMLKDPFGKEDPPQRTVWYQSKYYRANLHFRGTEFYLRDLHVYSDNFPQPFLTDTVKIHGIEQRLLAVLDGYHWSDDSVRAGHAGKRAMGSFVLIADGKLLPLTSAGVPVVRETGAMLETVVSLAGGGKLSFVFTEKQFLISVLDAPAHARLGIIFDWIPERSAFINATESELNYSFRDYHYSIRLENAIAKQTDTGALVTAKSHRLIRLLMSQPS